MAMRLVIYGIDASAETEIAVTVHNLPNTIQQGNSTFFDIKLISSVSTFVDLALLSEHCSFRTGISHIDDMSILLKLF